MLPYQIRVVEEKAELGDKLDKLSCFLCGDASRELSSEMRLLMEDQCKHMKDYYNCLERRISLF